MTAPNNDVLHSFWIPAFRTKEDVIPGRNTKIWFNVPMKNIVKKPVETNALILSEYDVLCAEYCGTNHAFMTSKVAILEKETFEKWQDQGTKSPGYDAENDVTPKGFTILEEQGCLGCHTITGDASVGPSFKDIYKRKIKVILPDGSTKEIISDESYIKSAINQPENEIVDGFSGGIMQPDEGMFNEEAMTAVIDYFQTI